LKGAPTWAQSKRTRLNTVIIESSLTFNDYQTARQYDPGALVLQDADKNEIFRLSFGPTAAFSTTGCQFNDVTTTVSCSYRCRPAAEKARRL
jgi:hypothetical protein